MKGGVSCLYSGTNCQVPSGLVLVYLPAGAGKSELDVLAGFVSASPCGIGSSS